MAFVISTKIEEEDYPALFEIQYLAFAEEPAILALYPGGLDPESYTKNVARFKKGLGFTDPHVVAAKATDKNGNICTFLVVHLFDSNPFRGTERSDIHFPEVDDEDRPWLEWLFNTKNDRKCGVKELQQPGAYAYLVALGTYPARQREGAASSVLKWALDLADSKGMIAMLEAGKNGVSYGLYEKRGFRSVDKHTYVDKEKFPHAQAVYLETMVRSPSGPTVV